MISSLLSINRSLPVIRKSGFPFTLVLNLNNEDFNILVKYLGEVESEGSIRKLISYREGNIYFYGEKETLKKIRKQIEDLLLFKSI